METKMSNCKRSPATTCGWFTALLLSALLAGCGGGGDGIANPVLGAGTTSVLPGAAGTPGASATDPTVGSVGPGIDAINVPTSTSSTVAGVNNTLTGTWLTATFTQEMDPLTITTAGTGVVPTFKLRKTLAGTDVPGTVTMDATNKIATFKPTAALDANTTKYTATVTTAAKNAVGLGHTAMAKTVEWSFTTSLLASTGQAPINLGTAGNFVILTEAGITNVPPSAITGNIGTYPINAAAMNNVSCPELAAGSFIYGRDATYTGPLDPSDVTCYKGNPDPLLVPVDANQTILQVAVGDMETAMVEAAGRTAAAGAPFLNLGNGTVAAQTLAPGVYTWGTPVNITGDLTLSGGANDVWIFQLSQTLDTGKKILLGGNAQAKNVFWRVAGVVALAATTEFTGIIMGDTTISLITGAKINGRMFSKADVTLQANTVTQP